MRLLRTPTLLLTSGAIASWVATEVFAWQGAFHSALGRPWLRYGAVPIYEPFAIWQWVWQWGWQRPQMFQVASLVFAGVGGALALCALCRPARPQSQARWARTVDLWRSGLLGRAGVVLGTYYGRVLRYNGEMHTLVVAPPGTGKTTSVVVPTCLTWKQSVLIHDPKREVYGLTHAWRSTFSRIIVLDPTSDTSDCFNPLSVIRLRTPHEMRDVAMVTEMLVDPEGEPPRSPSEQHFREMTDQFLQGMVLHGLYTACATTLHALDQCFLDEAVFADLLTEMETAHHTVHGPHPAVVRAVQVMRRVVGDRELSGILSSTSRALHLTVDPLVARMTNSNTFTLADLRERYRPCTVYLNVPYADQQRLRPLSRLLVRQMLDYMTTHLHGWRWRFMMLLDEVQILHRMPAIPQALNFARGYGLNVVAITPSLNELDRLYGPHHAFIEGTHVRVVFTPNDPQIAERFSRMTGRRDEPTTHGKGTRHDQRLLSETGLMYLPDDQALVLTGNGGRPVLVTKTPYYQSAKLNRRVAMKG